MNKGWIKIHRKMRDNPWMRKPAYRAVWLELLLEASHQPRDIVFKGERITLKEGQLTCGAKQLSEWTGVPRGTVERILKVLKSEEQIEVLSSPKYSLITVKNWASYQKSEEPNEEQVRNKRGTSEEQVRTPKELKNERMGRIEERLSNDSKPKAYGNEEINRMLSALKTFTGRDDFKESQKQQRQYGLHFVRLLGKIGKADFRSRIEGVLSDNFKSKNSNSLRYLYGEIKSAQTFEPAIKKTGGIAVIS